MNLRYIALQIEDDVFRNKYSSDFAYYTRFIDNYFSKEIRKYKFSTDGTFDMICIEGTRIKKEECKIKGINSLNVLVPFDNVRYEFIKGTEDCSYYLELLEKGFYTAAKFKNIPLNILQNLIKEFKDKGCRNEWVQKKKKFIKQDIEVILNCFFTTLDFKLVATINKISTKEKLCSGIIIRTKPDEIHFEKMFKDVCIDNQNIIITDASDSPRVLINLPEAQKGKFFSNFAKYVYCDEYTVEENIKFEETHKALEKILSYDGSGF